MAKTKLDKDQPNIESGKSKDKATKTKVKQTKKQVREYTWS